MASHWSSSGLLSDEGAMKQSSNGLIQAQTGWAGRFILSLHDSGSVATLGSCAVLWWKAPAVGQGPLGAFEGSWSLLRCDSSLSCQHSWACYAPSDLPWGTWGEVYSWACVKDTVIKALSHPAGFAFYQPQSLIVASPCPVQIITTPPKTHLLPLNEANLALAKHPGTYRIFLSH